MQIEQWSNKTPSETFTVLHEECDICMRSFRKLVVWLHYSRLRENKKKDGQKSGCSIFATGDKYMG